MACFILKIKVANYSLFYKLKIVEYLVGGSKARGSKWNPDKPLLKQ